MTKRGRLLLSAAMGVAVWTPSTAGAQDVVAEPRGAPSPVPAANVLQDGGASSERSDRSGEDIVVTAQKREQAVLDVPQSISVVTAAQLERRQSNNLADLLKSVPSLSLVEGTPGQGRLVLRGLNTGGAASTVAVYLDETPFGSSTGLANGAVLAGDFETFDVARVEVLRGPQGTLYGANSLGGLLKYVTNAPVTDRIEARAQGVVEDTSGGAMSYKGAAMINIPLADTLAIRASGSFRRQGGFVDSIGTAGSDVQENTNDFRNYGGRASLLWRPSSDLEVRLSGLLQNLEVDGPTVVESDPRTLDRLYGRNTLSQFVPPFSDVRYRLYNALVAYDLGFATVTSSTSYGTQRQTRRDDISVPLSGLIRGALGFANDTYLAQRTNNRKWTQELRLASDPGGLEFADWLVGGYYTNERALIAQDIVAVQPGTLTTIDIPVPGGLATSRLRSRYEEYAGFANATLHLGTRFDLDVGGRYSHNAQRASQTGGGALSAPIDIQGLRSSDDVWTYAVAPRFKIGERASIYARVSRGYRPGGPNVIPPGASGVPTTFGSDTVTTYEGGLKLETADRTFALDASGYHTDWNDIQLLATVGGFGVNVNASGATSDGAEVTATLRPTAGFVTSINFAYTHAHLDADADPAQIGALRGEQLPFTPKVAVSLNADYDWALGNGVKAFVGGSLRALSRQTGTFDPVFRQTFGRFSRIEAYEVLDLRAGFDLGRFQIEAFAKNLNNARGVTSVESYSTLIPALLTRPNGAVGTGIVRPRTVGLSVTAGF